MYREVATDVPGLTCLWVHRVQRPTRILPDACSDLIWRADHGAFVAGPDTTAAASALPAGTLLIGARLAPGAWRAGDLRDQRVPHPGLDPDWSPREAWWGVQAEARRLAAAPDPAVLEAAHRLAADPRRRVAGLAADLGLSDRQLRRRCQATAGHTPKVLQRILRFQAFVGAAQAARLEADLAWLAAEAGYADQAHLTHECRALSGLTPAALLRSRAGAAAGPATG